MRGEPKPFTYQQLVDAPPCVHSVSHQDCPSCVKHAFWYAGRMSGLMEAVQKGLKHAREVTTHLENDARSLR